MADDEAVINEVDELTEVIEDFMRTVPGEDDRPWDAQQMAKAILDAGYQKEHVPKK